MGSLNSNLFSLLILSRIFLFHVLLVPVSAKVFLSIDCGSTSSTPYTDKNSIEWVGDGQYIQTGESRNVIAKDIPDGWDSHVLSTLREFKTRNKNCYSIDINNDDKSEDTKFLVRAGFYYGNYDNKSKPPTFHLQFNGNNWSQIDTSMNDTTYEEVVFSLIHENTISVCVALHHLNNVPFISTLEVRSLDSDMYSYVDSNYPIFFMPRMIAGTKTVRFPDDSYDRVWESIGPLSNSSLRRVRNTSPSIKVDFADKIPETLFTEALMPLNSSEKGGFMYFYDTVLDEKIPMHFNAYFSEVTKLDSTQKRSFNISVDMYGLNGSNPSFNDYGVVNPPYGHALQVRLNNVSVKSSDETYEVYMVATNDSTLDPLINVLEGYFIGDKLVQGTNSKDVKSLALLQKSFIQLQDWHGDPCLPRLFNWDWVACDSDIDSPRITALYLNGSGLVCTLPDFSDMDALEIIFMHNNSLTGEIPKFLGTLPKLHSLDLADNNFSGTIPSSILKNKKLTLHVSGNPNLSSSSSNNKNSITSTIPIIVIGSVIIQMLDYIFGL